MTYPSAAHDIFHHHAFGHEGLVVALVELQVLIDMIDVETVVRIGPLESADELFAIRVK